MTTTGTKTKTRHDRASETRVPRLVPEDRGDGYTLPLVHVGLPNYVVEGAFWGGLVGAAVVGVIDPPLAIAVGGGVVVARHRLR